MINVIKQTPEEYSKQSRDYQVLGRLYSALFNVSKMYIDNMNIWNQNIDNKLSMLRAKTLNFDPQHDWDLDDLDVVTSCFKYLMRYKGTKNALKYIINILMKIRHVNDEIDENTVSIEDNMITIRLEDDLVSLGVMDDIIKYLLPAGYMYRIIEYKSYDLSDLIVTEAEVSDSYTLGRVSPSFKQYIGNNGLNNDGIKNKKRLLTHTYVYNNSEMMTGPYTWVPDQDYSDTEDDGTPINNNQAIRGFYGEK